MPLVTPPAIAPLPTPPSSSDPANFDTRADAFLGALPGLQSEANTLAQNVYGNAQEVQRIAQDAGSAQAAARDAAAQAARHAAVAGAASNARGWASGASYAVDDIVWGVDSPGVLFRCIAAHTASTRPDADTAHWVSVGARIALDPLAGPTRVTVERDARGLLARVLSTLDGSPVDARFARDAEGRLSGAAITHGRLKRTVTMRRDAQGALTQIDAEVTNV